MKNRHRVKTYGEVFTPRYMVDQMLDLVGEDLEAGPGFVDKTFLEPAAGDGNFLVAILERKLNAIEKRFPADRWPAESLFALASIYGIELLEDNHQEAQMKMLQTFLSFHTAHGTPCGRGTNLQRAAAFLIETNIVRGNTLERKDWQGNPIAFSWWNRVQGVADMVQREPFDLDSLHQDKDVLMLDFGEAAGSKAEYATCRIDQVHKEVMLP